jgi:lysozyme
MITSGRGVSFIIWQEGEVLEAYDSVEGGYPTIGVGHKMTPSEYYSGKIRIQGVVVRYANGITKEQSRKLLAQDLVRTEEAVNRYVQVQLTQGQFDALVDFTYNCGVKALANSTLLRKLNQLQYEEVPTQLRRWVYAGGVWLERLFRRREEEIELWTGGEE